MMKVRIKMAVTVLMYRVNVMKSGVYLEYAKQLIEKGEAYYCFCDKGKIRVITCIFHYRKAEKRLQNMTNIAYIFRKKRFEAKSRMTECHMLSVRTIRQKVRLHFHDAIYGDITVDNEELDDMILIKSDGYPTYNFANVVDDHMMRITHVVRGNEYLSSAPKYNRLYEAFGWDIPEYVHCPTHYRRRITQKLAIKKWSCICRRSARAGIFAGSDRKLCCTT